MAARPARRPSVGATLLLFVSLFLMLGARDASAQGATPAPAAGDCAAVLGIGAAGDGCINVVHVAPDAPNVDIYLDGEQAVTNLALGWYSGWLAVPAGEHRVQVTATGQAPDSAVIDASVVVEAGVAYQVAATGFLADIAPQVYPVDLTPLDEGSARVRVIHAVPDAPAVDVAVTGGDVLVAGLAFPDASEALEVPAGSYDLEVRPAGASDVVLPLPDTTFEAGTVYDVFAFGTLAEGIYALVVPSPLVGAGAATSCGTALGIGGAADACVNVVHASPDAPAVDVYLNGEQALGDLAFGSFSGWVAVPAGDYRVQVTPAGGSLAEAVIDAEVTVEAGGAYHIAATGLLADIAAQVYPVDLAPLAEGTARVRVIHASPDAPAVDVAVAGGDILVEGLSFPDASAALEVPAGTYDLDVRVAGTMDVALPLPGTALEANTVYDVVAVGQVADGSLAAVVIASPLATPVAQGH